MCLDACGIAKGAINDRDLAAKVAEHKQLFFREKDTSETVIEYKEAIVGGLRLVPEKDALSALEDDYAKMVEDGLFSIDPPAFSDMMARLGDLERRANESVDDAKNL